MVIPDPKSVDSCTVAWLLKRFVKVRLNRLISDKTWDSRAFVWCCASRCCAASSRRASRRSSLLLMARFSSRRSSLRHTSCSSPGVTAPSRRLGDLADPLAIEAVTGGSLISSISSLGSSVYSSSMSSTSCLKNLCFFFFGLLRNIFPRRFSEFGPSKSAETKIKKSYLHKRYHLLDDIIFINLIHELQSLSFLLLKW